MTSSGAMSPSMPRSRSLSRASDSQVSAEKARLYRKNKLFRRIEADIKERDRKRKPGRPEHYVDRDRLICVSLGEEDIRKTILKQRMFLTKNNVMVVHEQKGYRVLLEQAEHEIHKGQHARALTYLNKSAKLNPDDPDCLLLRSECFIQIQDYVAALADANAVLEYDQETARPFSVKGSALYHLGDFEHALVYYHRALMRNITTVEEEEVRLGIRRTQEAIDNALGSVHFLAMPALVNKIPLSIFGLPWHEIKALRRSRQFQVPSKSEKASRRLLLGQMSKDLDYLEELRDVVKDVRSQGVTRGGVKTEAEEAIAFLKNRQDFWSQFKPMFQRKR